MADAATQNATFNIIQPQEVPSTAYRAGKATGHYAMMVLGTTGAISAGGAAAGSVVATGGLALLTPVPYSLALVSAYSGAVSVTAGAPIWCRWQRANVEVVEVSMAEMMRMAAQIVQMEEIFQF